MVLGMVYSQAQTTAFSIIAKPTQEANIILSTMFVVVSFLGTKLQQFLQQIVMQQSGFRKNRELNIPNQITTSNEHQKRFRIRDRITSLFYTPSFLCGTQQKISSG